MSELTEPQKETVNEITPRGLLLLEGSPCECGGEKYHTKTKHRYSDTAVYTHTCRNCDNVFKTWTEG